MPATCFKGSRRCATDVHLSARRGQNRPLQTYAAGHPRSYRVKNGTVSQ